MFTEIGRKFIESVDIFGKKSIIFLVLDLMFFAFKQLFKDLTFGTKYGDNYESKRNCFK